MSSSDVDPNAAFIAFFGSDNDGLPQTNSGENFETPAHEDSNPSSDSEDSPSPGPGSISHRSTPLNARSLKQVATDLVQEYGLSDKVTTTVNKFIQVSSPLLFNVICAHLRLKANSSEERMLILFCAMMSAQERARADQWTISADLKTNIDQYTRALLLAPNLPGYRGTVDAEVMNAMRALNIHGLPNVKDVSESMEVLGQINTCLINFRSSIKRHISDSIEEDSNTRNIAQLCEALVRNTSIPITLQLYGRVAYLRWFYVNYPALQTSSDWWIKVDENLQFWRDEPTVGKDGMDRFFMKQYNSDVAKYGDPAQTGVTTVAPNAVPEWFPVINRFAKKVVPMGTKGSKKRKRSARS